MTHSEQLHEARLVTFLLVENRYPSTKKDGLPEGRPSFFRSVDAPKGCDLLGFFGRSGSGFGRCSSSVGGSGVGWSTGFGASGSSVGTSGSGFGAGKIGRAHVCTPATPAQLVCRPLIDKHK